MDPSASLNPSTTHPTAIPTASANYMALLMSKQGALVRDHKALRSQVIHLEPTLSFAIAYAGYTQTHAITHQALGAALKRMRARHEDFKLWAAVLKADKHGVYRGLVRKEARRLRRHSEALGELILQAGRAIVRDLDGKGRGGVFEMDVHMGAAGMVGVRWELEELGL
jgi:hypothetical protein